ncbi:MAG: hypothetical protein ABI912_07810 [Actinomycetota bacterium]
MPDHAAELPSRPRARRTVVVVAVATLLGFLAIDSVATALLPGQEYARPAALNATARRTGQVGDLLPAGALRGRDHGTRINDLRPAVLMIVRFPCECAARLEHVVAQADGSKVRVYVVGYSGRTQVDRLADAAGRGVVPLVDVHNVLSGVYHPGEAAILVLVRRDGIVTEIVDGVPTNMDLASRLPRLLEVP